MHKFFYNKEFLHFLQIKLHRLFIQFRVIHGVLENLCGQTLENGNSDGNRAGVEMSDLILKYFYPFLYFAAFSAVTSGFCFVFMVRENRESTVGKQPERREGPPARQLQQSAGEVSFPGVTGSWTVG